MALIGCGGGDDGDTPTRAEFIVAADRICHQARPQSEPLQGRLNRLAQGRGNTPQELREAARLLRRLADVNQSIVRRLADLRQPSEDRAAIARLLASGKRSVTLARDLADAYLAVSKGLVRSDVPLASAALGRASARSRRLARNYGLEVCGAPG
jgi:hypothetical protein